jgi:autotransporter-associated beta strand protein
MAVGLNNPTGVFLVNANRTLVVSAAIQNGPNGAAGLTLQGGGTVAFSAANNTYTGGTTITGATLLVAGQTGANSGTGTGAVTVNNAGTLGGNGRVGGSVTVNSGGALSPATAISTGTLTLGGSTTFENGGRFAVQIGASGTSDAIAVDHISSDLHFKNGSVLALSPVSGFVATAPASYTVAGVPLGRGEVAILLDGVATTNGQVFGTYVEGTGPSGKVTIQPTGFSLAPGDMFQLVRSGDGVALNFTPVPEPATVLGLAAAGLGLGGLVRRRVRRLG